MEYPWHHHPPPPLHPPPPPPPPPGNNSDLCPICSFSHFPFCPFPQHYPNPNFPNHNPNSYSHNQPPIFQLHTLYPNSQSHDQNPSFQLHDRYPNFQFHDQNPSFQSHYHNPNFQSHDQNPSFQLHPNFQSHDQDPIFQLHDHNPNFQFHNQKPNFQSHDQNPSFRLHNQHPSFRFNDQNPGFQPYDQSPSFRPPANYSLENRQLAQIRNPVGDYSPFDHGYKRPRPGELGVEDDERRLKLIRDHGGMDSNLLNGELREFFHEDSGLKRPRFDESGVGKKFTMPNLNTHYEIDAKNESIRRGYGKEPLLQTSFRDNYEQRQPGDDIYPKSYGLRSNIPPIHDIRSRVHSNDSAFVNHVSPTSLQVSPRNKTSFENTNVGIDQGINGPTLLLMDPKGSLCSDQLAPSSQSKTSSLFPISVTASPPIASSYDPFSEAQNLAQPYFQDKSHIHGSNGFHAKEYQPVSQRMSMNYQREAQRFPPIPSNKPIAVDASHIFKQPHRATRPDHIVVILRGLPGSGKSYLAKIMRDLEVDNGGNAPRIHSMDDYFMTEVEKVEESDNSKSSRGKKPVVKMVMEYCYEAEMEEAYRSSMLKTFKKTLDEGAFPFVIVDDRNLRVADFAQFWATAKRSGYEVYLLEPTYKDPAGCAARNVHGFTLDDIQKMADQWEEAPSLYLKLDAKSLLQGDDSKENAIQEVDMDTGDGESEDTLYGSAERNSDISAPSMKNLSPSEDDESDHLRDSKAEDSRNVESDHLREEVKELGRSKWSNDLEDDDGEKTEANKRIPNALSAMVKAYKREGKSVHWGDQAANVGFSIGAVKRVNTSLEIGSGSGYNSKSNPLPEDLVFPCNNGKTKTQSVFQERIRAERESFRAVFDRRRHRIGGLDSDEE